MKKIPLIFAGIIATASVIVMAQDSNIGNIDHPTIDSEKIANMKCAEVYTLPAPERREQLFPDQTRVPKPAPAPNKIVLESPGTPLQ